jgi:hypothetical protein
MDQQYRAGTVLKVIDYYAFPRTGSHFLGACISGLFDHITILPEEIRTDPEAVSRRDELSPLALYALELREQGVPYQPVWFNVLRNGPHGEPIAGSNPVFVVIRHPLASAYSAWRSRKRLGWVVETPAQMSAHLDSYERFYDAAVTLARAMGDRLLLIRYEDAIAGPQALERLVRFVGVQPKLSPGFVHWVTRFENFVRPGERTFYRAGDDQAWRADAEFGQLLERSGAMRDYSRFGYTVDVAKAAR